MTLAWRIQLRGQISPFCPRFGASRRRRKAKPDPLAEQSTHVTALLLKATRAIQALTPRLGLFLGHRGLALGDGLVRYALT